MLEGEGGSSVNCNTASWGSKGSGGNLVRGKRSGKCGGGGGFSGRGVDGGVKVGVDDVGEGGRGGVISCGGEGVKGGSSTCCCSGVVSRMMGGGRMGASHLHSYSHSSLDGGPLPWSCCHGLVAVRRWEKGQGCGSAPCCEWGSCSM